MKTHFDCIACIIKQVIEVSKLSTPSTHLQEKIIKDTLHLIASSDLTLSPPAITQLIHRKIRDISCNTDPYQKIKAESNALAISMLDKLQNHIQTSSSPLLDATKFAIAGNQIDFGAKYQKIDTDVPVDINQILMCQLQGDFDKFKDHLQMSKSIVYLADNAGEIVFDIPLITLLGPDRITVVVRGAPILNDATLEDAKSVNLHKIVKVIDNGSDAPGTIIKDCNTKLREVFYSADTILSKGQGNYETLSHYDKNDNRIFFLFKVKCLVVSQKCGYPTNTHVIIQNATA